MRVVESSRLRLAPVWQQVGSDRWAYAEAKEMVGSFVIIEAADKNQAVRVASLHPAAMLGESVKWGLRAPDWGF